MTTMKKVLDQIREAILASDKSQYRIAQDTGISRSRLSKLMSGQLGLSIEALEQLAEYLGYEIRIIKSKKGQ
jgi:transcriptional regulator with XRE-family HTH domain